MQGESVFTFQYGQIYYVDNTVERSQFMVIYIPIWLDLLCQVSCNSLALFFDLHSNMVRFIICASQFMPLSADKFTFQYGQIYY